MAANLNLIAKVEELTQEIEILKKEKQQKQLQFENVETGFQRAKEEVKTLKQDYEKLLRKVAF
jgi:uncharacterized membrane-anchored protein YhcB (DUF1043 family)